MSKVAFARKLAYLVELCAAADSMHRQTTLLVESLQSESRFAKSTLHLKSKHPRRKAAKR
jgi:hypothetical protein